VRTVRQRHGAPGGHWVERVHRVGSVLLGLGLLVFGMLGFVDRLEFLSTQGQDVLGLSSTGALSAISLIVATVLIAAAVRGGRAASTTTAVVGGLFLLSGLVHLAILDTPVNLLAFRMPNVVFSLIAGMLLLFLGAYGRISAGLPADNPYYRSRHPDEPHVPPQRRAEEDGAIADEVAVAEGHATFEQVQRVRAEAQRRADEARRRAWEAYQRQQQG
jgi:hypothetical protein